MNKTPLHRFQIILLRMIFRASRTNDNYSPPNLVYRGTFDSFSFWNSSILRIESVLGLWTIPKVRTCTSFAKKINERLLLLNCEKSQREQLSSLLRNRRARIKYYLLSRLSWKSLYHLHTGDFDTVSLPNCSPSLV